MGYWMNTLRAVDPARLVKSLRMYETHNDRQALHGKICCYSVRRFLRVLDLGLKVHEPQCRVEGSQSSELEVQEHWIIQC